MKKITKKLLFALMLISSICFISCSDGGGDGGSGPDPYVSFSGTTYGNVEWVNGFTDYVGGVPFGCLAYISPANICRWVALEAPSSSTAFEVTPENHIYIYTSSGEMRTYNYGSCGIKLMVTGHNSNNQMTLSSSVVVIKKSTASYIEGTFQGTTPSEDGSRLITGSFVFKRTVDNNWPSFFSF